MGGKAPKAPPPPPPPPEPPRELDTAVVRARRDERQRAIAAQGAASTILTGGRGVSTEASLAKTLLGQ
jgi:hypothetical protein